ncbi:MAG: zinc ribbon domain-containing protein, partial [Candidatus Binatia bacterium]
MAEEPTVRIPIRTCTQCGKPIVQGMTECFACGTPIEKDAVPAVPRRCHTCGKELARGVLVCSLCGTRLRSDRVKKTPPEENLPIPPSAPNTAPHTSPKVEAAQKPAPLPSKSMLSRVGMSLGTLVFLLLGFSLGKLLFTGSGADVALETSSSAPAPSATLGTSPAASSATSPALSSPGTGPTSVRSLGQVVTAEQLLPIRTFGTGAEDPHRSTKILRERVEEFLPSIRSLYNE